MAYHIKLGGKVYRHKEHPKVSEQAGALGVDEGCEEVTEHSPFVGMAQFRDV